MGQGWDRGWTGVGQGLDRVGVCLREVGGEAHLVDAVSLLVCECLQVVVRERWGREVREWREGER